MRLLISRSSCSCRRFLALRSFFSRFWYITGIRNRGRKWEVSAVSRIRRGRGRLAVPLRREGGCRVRVSPRTDTCQNDLTTGTEDGRAFPQVVEPLRGQSRTKLSWRIIVPRGVSRAAVQGASDLEHASKRGSDGPFRYRSRGCPPRSGYPPRSTSIDRSIDRSTYPSIHLRIGRPVKPVPPSPPFSLSPSLSPFANRNDFLSRDCPAAVSPAAFVDYFISTRCNDEVTVGSCIASSYV